jgi:hypothetical protein
MNPPYLHRTNINLNSTDVDYLQRICGHGWTHQVRLIVSEWVRIRRAEDNARIYIADKIDRENPGKGFP